MKIAFVVTSGTSIGGAQVHVRDLSGCLHELGHEVVVAAGGRGILESQLDHGVRYQGLGSLVREPAPLTDLGGWRELRDWLQTESPDILSLHSSKAGLLGRFAARPLRIPVVFTAHGWVFTEGVPKTRRFTGAALERLAAGLASKIITVSEHDRQLALRYRVAPAEKLVTVHNGVRDVPAELRASPADGPPRLCMVARFGRQKDHETLLRGLVRLQHLEWQLDLVGDGPSRHDVSTFTSSLGLEDRVHFWGTREDVPEFLARSHIYLLVSRWEGLPRSIIEAMRANLPVVASDVGGVSELVDHGTTGLVVGREDDRGLATSLGRLLQSRELRAQMGTAGRRAYEQSFTLERLLKDTLAVYRELGVVSS